MTDPTTAVMPDLEVEQAERSRKLVDVALWMDENEVQFHATLTPDEAASFAQRAAPWNDCTSKHLVHLIEDIRQFLKECTSSRSEPSYCFTVGVETGRVLYVEIWRPSLRRRVAPCLITTRLKVLGKIAGADAANVYSAGELAYRFRYWWD